MKRWIGILFLAFTSAGLLAQPACLVADTDCEKDSHCKSGRVCRDGECVSGSGSGGEGNGGSSNGGSSNGGSSSGGAAPCATECIPPGYPLLCCRPSDSCVEPSECQYSPCC